MRRALRFVFDFAAVYAAAMLARPYGWVAILVAAIAVGAYGIWCYADGMTS